MFRLINNHLQVCSLQVKSQDAVHTLGSQCVYVSDIFKPYHLPRRVQLAKCVTDWLKYILKKDGNGAYIFKMINANTLFFFRFFKCVLIN